MDGQTAVVADVQVAAKPKRRTYTAEYKRRILKEADACAMPGAVGALLRREGLYSSHLVVWQRARGRGELAALAPKKRGRKPTPVGARDRRITELERQLAEMTGRAQRAEALVDAQKNASWARRPPCGMKTGYHDGAPSFGQRRQVLVLRVRKKISMGRGPTLRDESGLP